MQGLAPLRLLFKKNYGVQAALLSDVICFCDPYLIVGLLCEFLNANFHINILCLLFSI